MNFFHTFRGPHKAKSSDSLSPRPHRDYDSLSYARGVSPETDSSGSIRRNQSVKIPLHVKTSRRQDIRETFKSPSPQLDNDHIDRSDVPTDLGRKYPSREQLEDLPPTLVRRLSPRKLVFGMRKRSAKESRNADQKPTTRSRRETFMKGNFMKLLKKDGKDDGDESDAANFPAPISRKERREISHEASSIYKSTLRARSPSWASGDSAFLTASAAREPEQRDSVVELFTHPAPAKEIRIDVAPIAADDQDEKASFTTASEGSVEVNVSALSEDSRGPTSAGFEEKVFLTKLHERQLAALAFRSRYSPAKPKPKQEEDISFQHSRKHIITPEQNIQEDTTVIITPNAVEKPASVQEEPVSPLPPSNVTKSSDSPIGSVRSVLSQGMHEDEIEEPIFHSPPKVSISGVRWRNGHKNFFPPWARGMAQKDVVRIVLKQQEQWRSESNESD